MSTFTHPFTHLLRHSGEVLEQVEIVDVHLQRRDGADVMLVKTERENAVREGLELSARALNSLFQNQKLRNEILVGLREALPWTKWLNKEGQSSFFEEFISTTLACSQTSQYQPLEKCINEWKNTAEIFNNPEMMKLFNSDLEEDRLIQLNPPR